MTGEGDRIEDLLVVGAGIVGALVAAAARLRYPGWRIALVERAAIGQGATGHSAGLMPVVGRTEAARRRAVRARQGYAALRAHGLTLPGSEVRACWVVAAARRRELEEHCGGPLEPLAGNRRTAPSAVGPAPSLERDEILLDAGLVARLDALAALRELVRWGRERGVACHEGIAVRRISGGPIWSLECSDGVARRAWRVVLATGPWQLLDPLWEPLWEPLWGPLVPARDARTKKIVALHVVPAPEPGARLILFPDEDAFLLPVPEHGRWLLSVPCRAWDWQPDDHSLSAVDLELARSVLARRFPRWEARVSGATVFGDAYRPDRQPIVQRLASSVVRVGCCSGSGVRLGPALAEEALAELS